MLGNCNRIEFYTMCRVGVCWESRRELVVHVSDAIIKSSRSLQNQA
jgi:hypothetical protein